MLTLPQTTHICRVCTVLHRRTSAILRVCQGRDLNLGFVYNFQVVSVSTEGTLHFKKPRTKQRYGNAATKYFQEYVPT